MESALTGIVKSDNIREGKTEKLPRVFKIEVPPEEYSLIAQKFQFKNIKRKSYKYFDTNKSRERAKLFNNKVRLRVAIKDSGYFLELKKRGDEKSEVSDLLSEAEFQLMLAGTFPKGSVQKKLLELGLFYTVQLIDTTETVTEETDFQGGQLLLDRTTGSDSETRFRVEFRSAKIFSKDEKQSILRELGISNVKSAKSKLKNFWKDR